jgi:predicted transcriptional regulator
VKSCETQSLSKNHSATREDNMSMPGVPSGGFQTVGQLVGTNELFYRAGQDCLAIALDLLATHTSGAPVLDGKGKFVGFISEFDLLGALESGKELSRVKAEEVMNKQPIAVHESTTIREAVRIMRDKHLLNLPVEKDGRVTYSITRHDLLRAKIGVGLGIEV